MNSEYPVVVGARGSTKLDKITKPGRIEAGALMLRKAARFFILSRGKFHHFIEA